MARCCFPRLVPPTAPSPAVSPPYEVAPATSLIPPTGLPQAAIMEDPMEKANSLLGAQSISVNQRLRKLSHAFFTSHGDKIDLMNDWEIGGTQNKWVCPSDRHLQLRAQLKSGWSVRTVTARSPTKVQQNGMTESEKEHIAAVLARAEQSRQQEQLRIGKMVDRLDKMRNRATGDGITHCLLCRTEFGLLSSKSYAAMCINCRKYVCQRNCGVDTPDGRNGETIFLCKICSEAREVLWKKSGAWFYREMPSFVKPGNDASVVVRNGWRNGGPKEEHTSSRMPMPSTSLSSLDRSQSPRPRITPSWVKEKVMSSMSVEEEEHSSSEGEFLQSGVRRPPMSQREINLQKFALHASRITDSEDESSPEASTRSTSPRRSIATPSSYDSQRVSAVPMPDDSHSIDSGVVQSDHSTQPQPKEIPAETALREEQKEEEEHEKVEQVEEDETGRGPSSTTEPDIPPDTPKKESDKEEESEISQMTSSVDNDGSLGCIQFTVTYSAHIKQLSVNLIRAKNLKAMDKNGFSDPYVKLHLIPGNKKATKLTSKTIEKTLNPEWNETLVYHGVTEEDKQKKTLRITVLDRDRIGSDFLGETRVALKKLPDNVTKKFNLYLEQALPIVEEGELAEERGKLLVALSYNVQQGSLFVHIKRGAEFVGMDSSGFSDPYCKVSLTPVTSKSHRQRTSIKKRTLNPQFNETLTFIVPYKDLPKKTLHIAVYDHDVAKADDYIGGVILSASAKANRGRHWIQTIENPGQTIEYWHKLELGD